MLQKRPFVEESFDVSCKQQRLEDSGYSLEKPLHAVSLGPNSAGDGKLESEKVHDFPLCIRKEIEDFLPGSVSDSSEASSSTSEECVRLEAQFSFFPSEQEGSPRPRASFEPENSYSYLMGCPPLKAVPIGPDFQVDIPDWQGQSGENFYPQASEASYDETFSGGEDKFVGPCVLPMPKVDTVLSDGDGVGCGRTDCCCEDFGSVRCVKQHIREARENLMKMVGMGRFSELGFDNMGEVVSENWSEEEEQLFHEIVASNPASLCKNFWNHLFRALPLRTSHEIVSYYFNVLVLQRRAEQNRFENMNIDSDDDEWQGSYKEEDEDEELCENDIHAGSIFGPTFHFKDVADACYLNGLTTDVGKCPVKLASHCSSDSSSQRSEKMLADGDFNDESCTSSDTGAATKADQSKNGCHDNGSNDLFLEPCDAKLWDVGFWTSKRNEIDFLPTCSVIEEVFGVGDWDEDDGKGLI